FFFSSRRRHTRSKRDWSSDVCSSDLFPWTLAKAFLSSPAALIETIDNRLRVLETHEPTEAVTRERNYLGRLRDYTQDSLQAVERNRAEKRPQTGKYGALLDYLTEIGIRPKNDTRVVIFAERVATLHALQADLKLDLKLKDEQVAILHGGLSDIEQQDVVESFKKKSSPIRVLVTGDLASEGVNLHSQCHELVHFDIPWSLIRIEQRNGRIDRY